MVKDFNEIKKSIKESGKLIYWFDNNGNIILIDSDKNGSKKKVTKMKNIEGALFRLNITFHSGDKPGQGGPLAVNVRTFEKENNTIIAKAGYKNGTIWFDRTYIERNGWNEKYMKMTYMIVTRKTFEFKIGIYNFSNLR